MGKHNPFIQPLPNLRINTADLLAHFFLQIVSTRQVYCALEFVGLCTNLAAFWSKWLLLASSQVRQKLVIAFAQASFDFVGQTAEFAVSTAKI